MSNNSETDNEPELTGNHNAPATKPTTAPQSDSASDQSEPELTGKSPVSPPREIPRTSDSTNPTVDTDESTSRFSWITSRIQRAKQRSREIDEEISVPFRKALIAPLLFLVALITVGVLGTIYHSFGLLSLTTGIIMLYAIFHPDGAASEKTGANKVLYTFVGLAFTSVGLVYLSIGIIIESPFVFL